MMEVAQKYPKVKSRTATTKSTGKQPKVLRQKMLNNSKEQMRKKKKKRSKKVWEVEETPDG